MRIDAPRPEQEVQLRQLWSLAFGETEAQVATFFSTGYAPDRCRCLTDGDRVAAALYWFDCTYAGQRLAYLYAVATHPAFRRRGLCRALMEDTHALLARQGFHGCMLTPADAQLRHMYAAMGYQDRCRIREFSCQAGKPISLRTVEPAQYARLRREYLPQGGVLQEGATLAYLTAWASCYAGDDFLLAAEHNGGQFRGLELLGNPAAGPGILAALGYAQGSFRVPGTEHPFAMFRPLCPQAQAPDYFGLALD